MLRKIQKLKKGINLISNMGFRYLFFRLFYLIKTKLGWQKRVFPINPKIQEFITLENWKKTLPPFFFYGKEISNLSKQKSDKLLEAFQEIQKGIFTFFSKTKINIGREYDWLTNPSTEYKYNIHKHWSEIEDLIKRSRRH